MNKLPKILIIDDDYGHNRGGRNVDRDDFCVSRAIKDVTGDITPEDIQNPIVEAVFYSGQINDAGFIKNDISGTLDAIKMGWRQWPRWALILLDLRFVTGKLNGKGIPVGNQNDDDPKYYFGLEILSMIANDPLLHDIPIIILSSMARQTVEKQFSELGVRDFIDKKDLTSKKLKLFLATYGLLEDDDIIGCSVPLLKCLRTARRRAQYGNDNILILGETGTGKELLAKYIHKQSPYCQNRFVKLNTQGVPDTLIEDKLFGHKKGAYNGANSEQPGAAELANNSTLFIDEFGDIPANIQSKLLDLIDKNIRTVQRLGSNDSKKLELQIVMATNRMDIMTSDNFRKDILYRAKITDPIILPPLRERREDIPLLAEFFLRKYENETHEAEHRDIDKEALHLLMDHDWPDNIRGLEQVIELAVSKYKGLKILSKNHISLAADSKAETTSKPVISQKLKRDIRSEDITLSINELIACINNFEFDDDNSIQWQWKGNDLREAFFHLMERYLRAGLEATRKINFEDPKGKIQHTPAINLILGPKKGKTGKKAEYNPTEAYAEIKRLLMLKSKEVENLISDPVVKEIFEKAKKNRSAK